MIVLPSQPVGALVTSTEALIESTKFTALAEPAQVEIATLTYPAFASTAQGDYVVITSVDGTTTAVWLDKDADGTPPSGAAYVASDDQIEVDITTGQTAAQVATAVFTAIGSNITDVTVANPSAGVVRVTQDLLGAVANPVPHNTGDTGAGSIAVAVTQVGADSVLQNKYIVINSAADAASYYAWANVNAEGVDPAVASKTGIEVAVSLNQSASQVAAAFQAAIDAEAAFLATVDGDSFQVSNAADGLATNATAGDSGFSFVVQSQGAAGLYSPSTAVSALTNSPSTIVAAS